MAPVRARVDRETREEGQQPGLDGRYVDSPRNVPEAAEQLAAANAADKTQAIVEEIVADKGYHSNQTLVDRLGRAHVHRGTRSRAWTPRGLQGRVAAILATYSVLWCDVDDLTLLLDLEPADLEPSFTSHYRHEVPSFAG